MSIHRQLMTILGKKGFDEKSRHNLVYLYTDGRTKSTRDLSPQEVKTLIGKLQNGNSKMAFNVDRSAEIECKKKRSIVLTIATRVGLHNPNDWNVFNNFMISRSILKRQLNKYDINELDKLVQQFRGIEANYNKSAKKIGTKANQHKFKLPPIILN